MNFRLSVSFLTAAFGSSWLDGVVTLINSKGTKMLSMLKNGRMTGATKAGEQTNDYVA